MKADALAERHQQYVAEYVARGNTELYTMLAEILKVHELLIANPAKEKLIKKIRRLLKENYNIKTQNNTKTTALVVKYITRASRSTAHVYGRVMDIAISEGVTSDGLAAYIEAKGGIERVRKAVDSAEIAKHKQQVEKFSLEALKEHMISRQPIASIELDKTFYQNMPTTWDVELDSYLCRINIETGKLDILGAGYPSTAYEKHVLREYMLMLDVAAVSHTNQFYSKCREHGLNMDLIHKWMKSNKISDGQSALELLKSLVSKTKSKLANL